MVRGVRRARPRCHLLSALVAASAGGPRSRSWAQVVTTCGNSGSPLQVESLADAVALSGAVNCSDGGTVEATWAGTITLDAPISIGSGTFLSITGADDLAEVDGGSQMRMFEVSPSGGLELTDLKLSGGYATSGGAIQSSMGTVILNNCVFDSNFAAEGGAVWAEGGELTIVGGEFSGNSASGNGGAVLAVDAEVVIQNGTRFEGNKAEEGGGLYCGGAENSSITAAGATASCSLSGAVFELNNASSETIVEFEFILSPWVDLYGGGAAAFYRGVVDISDSEFAGNYAQLSGGALYGGTDSVLTINNCRFEENVTPGYGGAMAASSATLGGNTLLANNLATRNGGGVFGWDETGTIELNDMLCTNNTVEGNGGCLYVSGGGVVNNGTVMRTSTGEHGGCIYAYGGCDLEINGGEFTECLALSNGAFIFASDGALVTVKEATVTNCVATDRAAVVYCSGDSFDLGGSKVTIEGGTFTDNQALELGGAFVAWGVTTVLTVTGGSFSNNTAKFYGGFVFLEEEASLSCEGAKIVDHYAGDQGGAIYARDATWVNSSCDLIGNGAPQGAAAYLTHTAKSANFENHEVTDNIASSGSVVYATATILYATKVNFTSGIGLQEDSSNRAIQLNGAALVAKDCVFSGWMGDTVIHNTNSETGSLVLDSCDFSESSAVTVVASPHSDAKIRNACVSDRTFENAAMVNNTLVLVDKASSCADSNICGPGECVNSVLGVLCECLADGECLNDGGTLSISLESPPPNVTFSPDPVTFELLVSAGEDGTTPAIWNLTYEAEELALQPTSSSGVLTPGGSITLLVTGNPLQQDVGGILVSSFVVAPIGSSSSSESASSMKVEVESAFYLCQEYEYAMPVSGTDDQVSCERCSDIDGAEGVDCENPGATLASLPLRKGYWRSSQESLVIHACIHPEACAGATQVSSSEDYCSDGYEGPYCASCQPGFGQGIGSRCHSCEGERSQWLIFAGALFTLLTLAFLGLAVVFLIGGLDAVDEVRRSMALTLSFSANKSRKSWQAAHQTTSFPPGKTTPSAASVRARASTGFDAGFAPAFAQGSRGIEQGKTESHFKRNRQWDSMDSFDNRSTTKSWSPNAVVVNMEGGPAAALPGRAAASSANRSVALAAGTTAGIGTAGAVPEDEEQKQSSERGREKAGSAACCGFGDKIKLWASRVPLDKLKILVVVWQILTVFPTITGTNFPPTYARFLSWIDVVNLDIGSIFSGTCILPTVSFYQRLLLTTLTPLALGAFLVFTYTMAKRRAGIGSASILSKKAAWSRHMAAGLLVTFLVFTSTSTVVFKTFACDEEAVEGESYLREDYSLSCDTTEHLWYEIYAGVMIIVYPIGIPLLYAFILWKNRDALNLRVRAIAEPEPNAGQWAVWSSKRKVKYASKETPEELEERLQKRRQNPDLVPSMFLWKDFGPDMYYYEVIECGRRILLTGALIFISPHTASQAAMACIFAFASLLGFELLRPHLDPADSWLYRLGCVVIFLSNFAALLIKVDATAEDDRAALGAILIAVNVLLILAVVCSSWFATRQLVEDNQNGESAFTVAKTMLTNEQRVAESKRVERAARGTQSENQRDLAGTPVPSSVAVASFGPKLSRASFASGSGSVDGGGSRGIFKSGRAGGVSAAMVQELWKEDQALGSS